MPNIFQICLIALSTFLTARCAWAVCLSPTKGEFASYEDIAFRDPSRAIKELTPHFEKRFNDPEFHPAEIAQLAAMLAESARQRDIDSSAIEIAEKALAQLPDKDSAIGLRLRSIRLMETNAASEAVYAESQNMLQAAASLGPEARACILKDVIFSMEFPRDFDRYARHLIEAHAQFLNSGNADERHVVLGRMSRLFIEAGNLEQALAVARISRAYFIKRGAYVRASTASLRALPVLYELNNVHEARLEAQQGLESAKRGGDNYGVLYVRMHLCASEALANSEGAFALCTEIDKDLDVAGEKGDREFAILETALATIESNSKQVTSAIARLERETQRPFRQPGDMLNARTYGLLVQLYKNANLQAQQQAAEIVYAGIQARIKANQDLLSGISAEVEKSLQHEPIALVENPSITLAKPDVSPQAETNHHRAWRFAIAGGVFALLSAIYVMHRRRLLLRQLRDLNQMSNANSNPDN
jgi:hypothetical protein